MGDKDTGSWETRDSSIRTYETAEEAGVSLVLLLVSEIHKTAQGPPPHPPCISQTITSCEETAEAEETMRRAEVGALYILGALSEEQPELYACFRWQLVRHKATLRLTATYKPDEED